MTDCVFDVASTLGVGTPSADPLPAAEPGIILLRVSAGLSLRALRRSKEVSRWEWIRQTCKTFPWHRKALTAGMYRLRLPVIGSNRKSLTEQLAMLPSGEELAPVTLVAAALACMRLKRIPCPLNEGCWVRCAECWSEGWPFSVGWLSGEIWFDDAYSEYYGGDDVWVSSFKMY